MPKLSKVLLPESTIDGARTVDKSKHATRRLLPMLTIEEESAKAFAKAVEAYIAVNKAITSGEAVVIVKADGTESAPAQPKDGEHQAENKVLIPNHDLPVTYADMVDFINKAVEALHRQQMGAWLTKTFAPKTTKGKSGKDGTVAADTDLDIA